uniref:ABC-type glutathione-S-conjugate transporter n=1 Tax=Gasterosteus aculeatus aculeatus TaxID=481459 RepID=A0AAQ4P9D6_GASAC
QLTQCRNGYTLWFDCDWNRTWYTANPDLTQCFQNTVLVWVPCIYLWLLAPFYCLHLYCHDSGRIRMSCLCCAKTVRLHFIVQSFSHKRKTVLIYLNVNLNYRLKIMTVILALCIIQLERIRGCRSSVFLFLFWVLAVVCSLVPLRAKIQLGISSDIVRYFAFFSYFTIQLAQLFLCCFAAKTTLSPVFNLLQNPCPVKDASFLSKILFWWFTGLVVKGYRTPLEAEDLWTLREEDTSWIVCNNSLFSCRQEKALAAGAALGSRLPDQAQLLRKLQKEQSSGFFLLRTMARKFGPYFLTGTLYIIFHDAFMFAIPQVLSLLLDFMRDEDAPLWKGYFYATLMFLLSCLQSLFNHQYMYTCFTVGMRVKTAVMGLVYRKSLVINSSARRTCTVGEIVNLVSADTQKLMDFVVYFNAVWLAPIEISLCLFFLWQHLGPSALAGIATVILIFPLNGLIAKKRSKLQVQMKFMDGRIRLMNEILSGIKILKFYAWEKAFLEQVLGLREKELKALKKSQILYSISIASFNSSSFLIAFSMFGVYVMLDDRNVLDAQKVFVSMALINILKTPLSQLPFAISTTMQAMVSLRRLGKYLCSEELREDNVSKAPFCSGTSPTHVSTSTLNDIIIHVPRGSLVAVVGHVGSGKSSLLSAMLGETEKRSGCVTVKGSVAYVPQQAWIQNATVQDNILFGREKLKTWYHRVLEGCALLPDLEILPAGDATEIGEKGLNLSGGQKQRVSLARAVYRKADVYLMDDPLSAVDAHVGQHIFDKVIGPKGVLRDKTRILVTHGMSFLPQADFILVLGDGEITESGSYQELLSRHGAFADFIHTFANAERKESAIQRGEKHSVKRRPVSVLCRGDTTNTNLQNMEPVSETDQEPVPEDLGKLTEADKARSGRVRLATYNKYFKTIGLAIIVPIVFLYAFQQGASLAYNYWLSVWADDPIVNGTQTDTDLKLIVFGALGFVQGQVDPGLLMFASDCTPSGNLLNRFSKEIDAIDCMVPDGLKMMLCYVFKLMEVCIIVLLAMPFAAVVILPLALLYAFVQSFYVATSCQLRRLEAVSRSPIYTHFNETVQGASVIRAFGEQSRFILQTNKRVDFNQTSYFPRFVATRWLAVNLEFVGNGVVLAAAILSVMGKGTLSPGIVGLAVSKVNLSVGYLQVTGILSWIVRSWTDVENNIVSVERVNEYADTPKEASWSIEGSSLPPDWPQRGTIEFQDYGLQYRKGLELALKGITLQVHERERVGIVGRTGAGKSSLALGIFRILEAAKGKILIDGVDIADVGLHDLRSRITIIPQDPVLFSGSLRMNLDPFDTYTDEEVWRSLELAHLQNFVSNLPDKINHECSEGGENLSLGQRQLVCLARALLRKTKILVLDEATAAVDLETDALIQSTIRTQFEDCTVLTVAHRLNTIMDYTRVIVMDRGHISEMDTPANLIAQRGQFYRMCREAGLM